MIKQFDPAAVFDAFNGKNILVIGDVMLDAYVSGSVKRISPEAPVPVVLVSQRYNRLGGAANVALNLRALGANPVLCSVIGNDIKGRELLTLMDESKLTREGMVMSDSRLTTTKFRIIGNKVQMLRVDEEDTNELNDNEFNELSLKLTRLFKNGDIHGVIFEDYDKGLINKDLIDLVVTLASFHHIPVTVDPKRNNFLDYHGVTLFKPNLKELEEGTGNVFKEFDIQEVIEAAEALREQIDARYIMVTLSEHGVVAGREDDYRHFPAEVRNIADVSGAGDTVISVVTLGLAAGLEPGDAAYIANIAGGLVCEKVGVVPVDKKVLLDEINKLMP